MHADKLVPAVIAAVAVVCLLLAGRAHGLEEYVPSAAASQQVTEPLVTNQNEQYLPQPEVMPVPNELLARPAAGQYAPQAEVVETQPGGFLGALRSASSYFRQQHTTTTNQPEPAPETTTEPEPEPAPGTTTEPEPAPEKTIEPEPATPTAPGQGDFYRTGDTPTTPEPPATPSSPASDTQSSYSGGGGGDNKQVDDDGEPVDGLSPKAIANIVSEHNVFRAKEHVPPLV